MKLCGHDNFISRSRELQIFTDLFDKISASGWQTLFISGPPGIGKSCILEKFHSSARDKAASVYSVSFREGIHLANRSFWHQLFPDLSEITVDGYCESTLALLHRTSDFLRKKCAVAPCVILIDNLHLAGRPVFAGITDLFYELKDYPLLFVASYQEISPYSKEQFVIFLSSIKSISQTTDCSLECFSAAETSRLTEKILKIRPPDTFASKLVKLTGGNPLFIREIALYLSSNEKYSLINRNSESLWKEEIPKASGILITGRLSLLSENFLSFLRAVALIGEVFTINQLHTLERCLSVENPLHCLKKIVERGFLTFSETKSEYRFTNSIIHQAVLSGIPDPERRSISSVFIEEIEKLPHRHRDSWSLQLAKWLKYSDSEDSDRKIRYYTKKSAVSALGAGCYEEAAELFGKISDESHPEAGNREEAEIFSFLGLSRLNCSRINEGLNAITKALAYYCKTEDVESIVKILSRSNYHYSGFTGFNRHIAAALEKIEADSLPKAILLLYQGNNLLFSTGDYHTAEKYLLHSLELGKKNNDTGIIIHSLIFLSVIDYTLCRYESARQKIDKAEVLSSDSNDSLLRGLITYGKILLKLEAGKYSEAVLLVEECISIKYTYDNIKTGIAFYLKARLLFQAGCWKTAWETSDEGLSISPEHLNLLFHRAVFEYSLGETDTGDSFYRKLNSIKRRTPAGPYLIHIYTNALAIIKGRLTGSTGIIKAAVPELELIAEHPNSHPFIRLRAHLLSASAAVLTGNSSDVLIHYNALLGFRHLHLIRPYLLERVLGLAANASGSKKASEKHFLLALDSAEKYNDLVMKAWIHFDFGISLLDVFRTEAGKNDKDNIIKSGFHLQAAYEAAESLGLQNLASFALQGLDEWKSGKSGTDRHESLTKRENQVLELLSRGLTNESIALKLGISVYTVANHIHSILEKTGSSNRTEAASRISMTKTI